MATALNGAFLGGQDPLNFFMAWKTPAERYRPLFDATADSPGDDGDHDGDADIPDDA